MADQPYEIAHAENFPLELGRAPKKVRNAYKRTIIPKLRVAPANPDPPRIKQLKGYKGLWRLRVSGDYRLVYRVYHDQHLVCMLMLDHRAKIYDRLGANPDGTPGTLIIADAEELLEIEPTPEEIGEAEISLAESANKSDTISSNVRLPVELTTELLIKWGIPGEYHTALTEATTEEALLALGSSIPDQILERVIDAIWPRSIVLVTNEPVRLSSSASELDSAADGLRSLDSFLLSLDEVQEAFVDRFKNPDTTGPWLLKGGPGSGKSTVALYCILSIVRRVTESLPIEEKPIEILFTTYTNSLINGFDIQGLSICPRSARR